MQTTRFQTIASRFAPPNLRTSFRRSPSAASSRASSSGDRLSYLSATSTTSTASSPAVAINSVIVRQPSIVNLEEERRSFASELSILEPRPIVYWAGLEERMGSL
jgi:hypothetical protein